MTKIAIAGATGFIGKNLMNQLRNNSQYEIVALSRKVDPIMEGAKKDNITWKRCNGFSLLEVEKATEGCDVLIYLTHSMLPSTSLAQGSFSDFDLYLADNFSRASKKNKIKKIIYLSGIIPNTSKLSEHLKSRLEVEEVLSQYENDLTVLRAGLIVGKDGSSFKILERLIARLPILICPAWTQSKTQPIDLQDVLASLLHCINQRENIERVYDIGGPDILTYRSMLQTTAEIMGKKRVFLNVPLFSPGLSKLWVSKVASSSKNLVYPLVDSLKHEMVTNPKQTLILPEHRYCTFKESLSKEISVGAGSWMRTMINYSAKINFRWLENVTSIQRMDQISISSAERVAQEYFIWLSKFLAPIFFVSRKGPFVTFKLLNLISLIELKKNEERSTDDRIYYYVVNGLLSRKSTMNGRLEFRWVPSQKSIVVALLDFRPSLPWFVYKYTQALIHLFVMKQFEKYLRKNVV